MVTSSRCSDALVAISIVPLGPKVISSPYPLMTAGSVMVHVASMKRFGLRLISFPSINSHPLLKVVIESLGRLPRTL